MRFVFWQNMLSHHQAAHIRGLAALGHSVAIVADEVLSHDRQQMGWTLGDFGPAEIVLDPSPERVEELVRETHPDGIHIVGGYRGYRVGRLALDACWRLGARVGLMAEAGDRAGWKGLTRLGIWRYEWARFGRRVDFVLAMGQMGERWFRDCGYRSDIVFPYGYFTEPSPKPPIERTLGKVCFQISFVGQCHPRKGVDLALRALAAIRDEMWEFTIMGDGPSRECLRSLALQLGIAGHVVFRPYGSSDAVYNLLADADLLILPSRFDGWGVVINEALQSGVPVLCTDRCGASDLLQAEWRGRVVRANDVRDLGRGIAACISRGKLRREDSQRILEWSQRIEGISAAGYFVRVMECVYSNRNRPTPPWYDVKQSK